MNCKKQKTLLTATVVLIGLSNGLSTVSFANPLESDRVTSRWRPTSSGVLGRGSSDDWVESAASAASVDKITDRISDKIDGRTGSAESSDSRSRISRKAIFTNRKKKEEARPRADSVDSADSKDEIISHDIKSAPDWIDSEGQTELSRRAHLWALQSLAQSYDAETQFLEIEKLIEDQKSLLLFNVPFQGREIPFLEVLALLGKGEFARKLFKTRIYPLMKPYYGKDHSLKTVRQLHQMMIDNGMRGGGTVETLLNILRDKKRGSADERLMLGSERQSDVNQTLASLNFGAIEQAALSGHLDQIQRVMAEMKPSSPLELKNALQATPYFLAKVGKQDPKILEWLLNYEAPFRIQKVIEESKKQWEKSSEGLATLFRHDPALGEYLNLSEELFPLRDFIKEIVRSSHFEKESRNKSDLVKAINFLKQIKESLQMQSLELRGKIDQSSALSGDHQVLQAHRFLGDFIIALKISLNSFYNDDEVIGSRKKEKILRARIRSLVIHRFLASRIYDVSMEIPRSEDEKKEAKNEKRRKRIRRVAVAINSALDEQNPKGDAFEIQRLSDEILALITW